MAGPDLHLVHCLTRVFPGDVSRLPHEGHLKAEQLPTGEGNARIFAGNLWTRIKSIEGTEFTFCALFISSDKQ